MDKSVLSFEHEAWYHDLGSEGTYSGSLPPATQDSFTNFSDFGISEDQNYNPSHHFACQTVDPAFDDATNKIKTYPRLPFTGPSYVDTAYEHDQLSSQPQSGPQPVSMHYNQKLAENDTYTKSSGVYSPEELSPTRNDRSTNSPYHCPRCDKGFTTRIIVKNHFPHCISMHGNPDQLRWDDHITLKPLRKEETGDEARSYQFHKGKITDKARTDKFRDSLTAYSGVVIPSRLPPGQSPVKFVSSKRQGSHLCAVCSGGPFSYIYHVKSHFNNCVRKNGNPRGANWYDRLDSKHKKRYLPGRFDAPRTIQSPSGYAPFTPPGSPGDRLSRPAEYASTPFSYAPAMPQGYQSSLSEEYPSTIPSGYTPTTHHGDRPPLSAEYPSIPFGYAPI